MTSDPAPADGHATAPPVAPGPDSDWQRLDGRMIAVDATRLTGSLLPLALAVVLRNTDASGVRSTLTTLAMIGAASAIVDLLRWATTSYRVTDARVEVRSGLLTRRHRSMPRDRIRRVDATAKLLHRAFGLSVVALATGDRKGSADDVIKLDAVTIRDAVALRQHLLGTAEPGAPDEAGEGRVLAALNWRWAPYDVLSFWTLAIPAVALGAALQTLNSIGVTVDEVARDDRVADTVRDVSPLTGILLATGAVAVVGVVGALALFVETWWDFRLVRDPHRRLRMHRGLLTSRTLSLDEGRLRGVELVEPLLLRAAGGARLHAVTTGLAGAESSRGERADALMPPSPTADTQRVAAAVLDLPVSPTADAVLRRHPSAARRRRVTRAVAAGALAWAALAVVHVASDGVAVAALAAPAAVTAGAGAYALDTYRNLGHAVSGRYLVVRRGSLARRTVALQRTGVIGWNVRRTLFQRRLGLATLEATTAAGRGSYKLSDVDTADGLRFASGAVPGVLAPFLADG
jgi:putative membrane protein